MVRCFVWLMSPTGELRNAASESVWGWKKVCLHESPILQTQHIIAHILLQQQMMLVWLRSASCTHHQSDRCPASAWWIQHWPLLNDFLHACSVSIVCHWAIIWMPLKLFWGEVSFHMLQLPSHWIKKEPLHWNVRYCLWSCPLASWLQPWHWLLSILQIQHRFDFNLWGWLLWKI